MKCDNCGKLLGANILKCPNCGKEIKSPEEDIEVLDTEEVEVHNEPSIISSEEISLDNIEDSKVIEENDNSSDEDIPVVEEDKPKKKKKKKKKSKKDDNPSEESKEDKVDESVLEDDKKKEETLGEEKKNDESKEEAPSEIEQKEEVKEDNLLLTDENKEDSKEETLLEDNKNENESKEEISSEEKVAEEPKNEIQEEKVEEVKEEEFLNIEDQSDDTLIAREAESVEEEPPVVYEHIVNGDEVVPLPPKKTLVYRIKDFFNSWFEGYEKASEIKSDDRTTRLTLDKIYEDTNKRQRDKKIDSNDVFMFWLACFVVSFISFFIFTFISFIVDIVAGKHNNIPLLTFIIPAFQIGIPILLTGFGWLWGIIYSLIKRNGNKNR